MYPTNGHVCQQEHEQKPLQAPIRLARNANWAIVTQKPKQSPNCPQANKIVILRRGESWEVT